MQRSSSNRKLTECSKWRILQENTERKLNNFRYVITNYFLLHNISVRFGDPCEPRLRLEVQQLELFPRSKLRNENPNIASSMNSFKNYKLALKKAVQSSFQKVSDCIQKSSFSCYALVRFLYHFLQLTQMKPIEMCFME